MSSNAYTVNIVNADELYVAGAKISGFTLGAVKEDGSNVGLNTNFPKLQLDISGTGAIRIPAGTTNNRNFIKSELISTGGATDLLGVLRYNKTTSRYEATYEHTGQEPKWGNFVMEDSSGNVGIGTTSPRCSLNITNTISPGQGTIPKFTGYINNNSTCSLFLGKSVGTTQNYWGMWMGTIYETNGSHYGSYIQSGNHENHYPILLNPVGGNVGIGTTSPGRKFEVKDNNGTVGIYANSASSYDTGLEFGNSSISDKSYILKKSTGFYIDAYDTLRLNASTSAHNVRICEGGGNVSIGPNENNGYKLYVSGPTWLNGQVGCAYNSSFNAWGTSRFKWPDHGGGWYMEDSSWIRSDGDKALYIHRSSGSSTGIVTTGRVGIGTSSPGAKLEVNGNIKTTDHLEINSHGNAFQITGGNEPDKGLKFFTSGGDDYADFVKLDFVRIGSDGNSCELRVVGDQRFFFGSHDYCYIRNRSGQDRPNGQLYLYYGYVGGGERNTGVFLSASPNESNYINNGGNVGIGTNSPTQKLEVNGNIKANYGWLRTTGNNLVYSETHGRGLYFQDSTWLRCYGTFAFYNHSGVSLNWTGRYYSEHNYFAYSDGSSTVGIECAQAIVADWFGANSDRRIKKNIEDIDDGDALKILRKIPVRYYNYKDDVRKGSQKVSGFIAQEVKEVFPMAVSISPYSKPIPNILKKITNEVWEEITDGSKNKWVLKKFDLIDSSGVILPADISRGKSYKFEMQDVFDEKGEDKVFLSDSDGHFIFEKKWKYLFLFGICVDDFLTIDKNKIFAINFSASQEIDRIQQAEKTKLEEQTTEIISLKNKIITLETQYNNLQQQVQTLIDNQ